MSAEESRYALVECVEEHEMQSELAWFRYRGWLTLEAPRHGVIAISPATPTTPHWVFAVQIAEPRVIGGAYDLESAIRLAAAYIGDGARWTRRDERALWGTHF